MQHERAPQRLVVTFQAHPHELLHEQDIYLFHHLSHLFETQHFSFRIHHIQYHIVFFISELFFAIRFASAVLATAIPSVCLSVCLSVCPSVTRRYCVKTTARSTLQFLPRELC